MGGRTILVDIMLATTSPKISPSNFLMTIEYSNLPQYSSPYLPLVLIFFYSNNDLFSP
jgi:hypothetical protein